MTLFNQILIVLAALAGVGFGYSLSRIAPREVVDGKKYFAFLEKLFFVSAFVPLVYMLWTRELMMLAVLALLLFGGMWLVPLTYRVALFCVLFAFVLFYITTLDIVLQLIQGSLVFLYGLPAGTLLRKKFGENEAGED